MCIYIFASIIKHFPHSLSHKSDFESIQSAFLMKKKESLSFELKEISLLASPPFYS